MKRKDEFLFNVENKGFIYLIYNYYLMFDLENGTKHAKIFKKLYLDRDYKNFNDILSEYGIDISTLERYRARYNAFAKKFK